MLAILLCSLLIGSVFAQQTIDAEHYILNLHHDHCTSPMAFSLENLKCECPPPFERSGKGCLCSDCFRQTLHQTFSETDITELPEYINEVFESLEIHDE